MKLDLEKLDICKELIRSRNVQGGYKEFIQLFRYLRFDLEKELSEFYFSGDLTENKKSFSVFQMSSKKLEKMGFKIQVEFVHDENNFEVWISGYNREIHNKYGDKLKSIDSEYHIDENFDEDNYILRSKLIKEVDISDAGALILELKDDVYRTMRFMNNSAFSL